jgi:hypothetical protein
LKYPPISSHVAAYSLCRTPEYPLQLLAPAFGDILSFFPSDKPASDTMSMRDLISGEAELDEEENDESFDEDTGEPRRQPKESGGLEDSSEEEEDDDDEEAAAAVRVPVLGDFFSLADHCPRFAMASLSMMMRMK